MFDRKEADYLNFHQKFMLEAFRLAEKAGREQEIPVGAVIVHNNVVIGKGYNQTERLNDPTAHAEMIAISAACSTIQSKYLENCSIYVTLEPCPMCAGAIVWSKLEKVIFGAADEKAGACGTIFNLAANKKLNHRAEVIQGVMEDDCRILLQNFFAKKR